MRTVAAAAAAALRTSGIATFSLASGADDTAVKVAAYTQKKDKFREISTQRTPLEHKPYP